MNTKGDTLVEVVVALAILSVVVLTLVRMTTVSINNAVFARNQASATKYAQEMLENMRFARDRQGSNFFSPTSECFDDNLPDVIGSGSTLFIRHRDCDVTANLVRVVATVSWSDAKGQHQSRLETEFTPWK